MATEAESTYILPFHWLKILATLHYMLFNIKKVTVICHICTTVLKRVGVLKDVNGCKKGATKISYLRQNNVEIFVQAKILLLFAFNIPVYE